MISFLVASLSLWFLVGTSSFIGLPVYAYFSLIFVLFGFLVTHCKKVDSLCLAFIAACLLSLIWNDLMLSRIDPIFKCWERLAFFTLTFGVYSPMMQSEFATKIRKQLFNSFYWMSLLIVGGSLLTIGNGITSLNAGYAGYANTSLTLGLICGFVTCCSFSKLMALETSLRNAIVYGSQATIAVVVMSAAGSRSALLATSLACFATSIASLTTGKGQDRVKGQLGLAFVAIGATTVLLRSQSMIAKITGDLDASEAVGILATSRTIEYGNRIAEFSSSPFFGIGFGNADYGLIKWSTGAIESGTSWLAILSMLGLFGITIFGLVMVRSIVKSFRSYCKSSGELQDTCNLNPETPRNGRNERAMSLAVFTLCCFFFVHLFFEGYAIFAGSTDFALLWLVIGLSENDVSAHQGYLQGSSMNPNV